MKKKDKKTSRQVKRPPHKKPRPKKQVEARLPKVVTESKQEPVEITKTVPEVVEPASNIVTFELPINVKDEQELVHKVNVGVDTTKKVAEQVYSMTEHTKMLQELKYLYEPFPHITKRSHEELKFRNKNSRRFENDRKDLVEEPYTEEANDGLTKTIIERANVKQTPIKMGWLQRLMTWLKST